MRFQKGDILQPEHLNSIEDRLEGILVEDKPRSSFEEEIIMSIRKSRNDKIQESLPAFIKEQGDTIYSTTQANPWLINREVEIGMQTSEGLVTMNLLNVILHLSERVNELSRAVRGNNERASKHDGSEDAETLSRE